MSTASPLFLGIDLGTGGVRCLVIDPEGAVVARSRSDLARENVADGTISGASEQDPADWEQALAEALDALFTGIAEPDRVAAIAVDSTSGTVLPVDGAEGRPLGRAFLYNDRRAVDEASRASSILGERISPTFSLPKILWMRRHLTLPAGTRFVHATDYVNEWLTGTRVKTDFTNAMKSGLDLEALAWPEAIESQLGLPLALLPAVCRPGEPLGFVSPALADRLGLGTRTLVIAGATDSNAAFYASGAGEVGEWCNTIGTTLALKGIAAGRLEDPEGRIYCHRHPDLEWLPGGASNCGGEVLKHYFPDEDLAELDRAAQARETCDQVVFPLVRIGERLPFAGESIEGFVLGDQDDRVGLYLGCLEGVAFVERMILELLQVLGAVVGERVFATGGGAQSRYWLQVRADVLRREFCVPQCPESAFGAAVLAAAGFLEQPVGATSRSLVRTGECIVPNRDATRLAYLENKYERLRVECARRGYV